MRYEIVDRAVHGAEWPIVVDQENEVEHTVHGGHQQVGHAQVEQVVVGHGAHPAVGLKLIHSACVSQTVKWSGMACFGISDNAVCFVQHSYRDGMESKQPHTAFHCLDTDVRAAQSTKGLKGISSPEDYSVWDIYVVICT